MPRALASALRLVAIPVRLLIWALYGRCPNYRGPRYDVDAPILQGDWGSPLGPGKEVTPGVFSREFEKATISLDCARWTSTFARKK